MGQLQLGGGVTATRIFNQRIELVRLDRCGGERAPIHQTGLITIALAGHVFLQMLALLLLHGQKLTIVKRSIKCEPRRV